MTETTISSIEPSIVLPLFGAKDQHLKRLRERFDVNIILRNGLVRISGDNDQNVTLATAAIERLSDIVRRQGNLTPDLFDETMAEVAGDPLPFRKAEGIDIIQSGREIKPKTAGQAAYIEAIRKHDLVFAIGPAGTGKTYLAVAMAVEALKHQLVRKIVLVRPAVEAGESLGFLPGDMQAKINPYLRPLLDAIHEMIGYDQVQRLILQDVIEVAPLAYMRGRTLNQAFIILDEAQNTTVSQMKMFLTRMGFDSKIVVSGDPTQTDLPRQTQSGLNDALRRLKNIRGVKTVRLGQGDIVRNRLVQQIVEAYEYRPHRVVSAEADDEQALDDDHPGPHGEEN
ncbi:MAG: PhoH family protein [Pirellulaceae bacterium]|jgi:phosphate starvation-inducible protein PhoH and related proteins|nr:PhoH family protein [Pirellulaceae bacterium]